MDQEILTGSYILLINLPAACSIVVGRKGEIHFRRGCYAYVGSAMKGIRARVLHHLRKNKKLHWHIDYLLQAADIQQVITFEANTRMECQIARSLMQRYQHIPGFGCSDCQCKSHLFYLGNKRTTSSQALAIKSLLERVM